MADVDRAGSDGVEQHSLNRADRTSSQVSVVTYVVTAEIASAIDCPVENEWMTVNSETQPAMPRQTKSLIRHKQIAILTEGFSTPFLAKTAISLLRYRTGDVAAVIDKTVENSRASDLFNTGGDIPIVKELADVPDADSLYIGIAPPGGKLPSEWRPIILEALRRGLDVVSGLHDFVSSDEELVRCAAESESELIDVRRNDFKRTASCRRFPNDSVRIHTVGHDCSLGKMVAAVETQRALEASGHDAKFLATGQTGIMISGEGVPIDCVVADFVAGAAEELVKDSEDHDYLLIEGQGSISHPAYSGVTLGLLHGAAPQGLIYCYEAGRTHVKGFDDIPLPPIDQQMSAYLVSANLRHPCKFIAVAVNTRKLSDAEAQVELERAAQATGLPTCDVYRTGTDILVQACIDLRKELC